MIPFTSSSAISHEHVSVAIRQELPLCRPNPVSKGGFSSHLFVYSLISTVAPGAETNVVGLCPTKPPPHIGETVGSCAISQSYNLKAFKAY